MQARIAKYLAEEFSDLFQNGTADASGYRFIVTHRLMRDVRLAIQSEVCLLKNEDAPFWISSNVEDLPDPRTVLATATGIIDLLDVDAGLIPPTPELFNLNGVDYGYDPDATCPQWHAYLEQI